jgi:hypothetical protein
MHPHGRRRDFCAVKDNIHHAGGYIAARFTHGPGMFSPIPCSVVIVTQNGCQRSALFVAIYASFPVPYGTINKNKIINDKNNKIRYQE